MRAQVFFFLVLNFLDDMTWSVRDLNKFIQHPLIHSLMTYDTQNNNREIEYIEHNYSSDALTDQIVQSD